MDKVSTILTTGQYKTKEDIYRKVFNEDELQALGYNMNKTISSNKSNKSNKEKKSSHKNEEGFFLTQGNNIEVGNKENNEIEENI